MERTRLVLGAMTGTSIDGIDLALVRVAGSGRAIRAETVATRSAGLGDLAPRLRAAATQVPMPAGDFARLALELGELHAREGRALLDAAGIARIDLAAIHGQTVFHQPPASWQLINAHPVARALGCAVAFDLRGTDLAHGGEGAPLTPLADWVLFRTAHARAVVNLGGFANATVLPPRGPDAEADVARVCGADLCACHQLLAHAARRALGRASDADGAAAARGTPDPSTVDALRTALAPGDRPRSLGTGDERFSIVDRAAADLAPEDLLASVAAAVGASIGAAIAASGAADAVLAGGGTRHRPLVAAIARAAQVPVAMSDAAGIPASHREAIGWAVLGALAQDGVPPSLPAVTGRAGHPEVRAGAWICAGITPA
ncbi:MAG: anhydro-N-acetylmuramic acid kinase [Phycisphaerales bacterium]